jgi:hypothetical protein
MSDGTANILSNPDPNKDIEAELREVNPEVEGREEAREEGREEEEEEGFDLLLGDVIKIQAPQNEILNEQTFFIKYIDAHKISLINIVTSSNEVLHVDENGVIDDVTITEIELLYRQKEIGFSRQNGLLPNTWVNLSFGGDVPAIITAEITNLEGDMIEITTYPEKKILYIPFDYKGIPENMYLEKIEIRKPPEEMMVRPAIGMPSFEKEKLGEPEYFELGEQFSDDDEFGQQMESDEPVQKREEELRRTIAHADKMIMGEMHESITEFVETSDRFKRFNINVQKDEMLESMLSVIPTRNRTTAVMSDINRQIERYTQLRAEYSELDKNGVVKSMIIRSHLYKPLKQSLLAGENKLNWVIYGVKNIPKFYYVSSKDDQDATPPADDRFIELTEDLNEMESAMENIITSASEQNKYNELYNTINPYFTPFNNVNANTNANDSFGEEKSVIQLDVKNDMNVFIDNYGDYKTDVITKRNLGTKRFVSTKYTTGLTRLEQAPIGKNVMNADVVNMTPPDKMTVTSIVTLPTPVILFSKINLPGTNILERANLGGLQLNYWKFLNGKTKVKSIDIAINQSKEEMEQEEKEKERLERERKKAEKAEMERIKTAEETETFLQNLHINSLVVKKPALSPYFEYFKTINSFSQKQDDSLHLSPEGTIASIQQKREKYDIFLEKLVPTTKEIFNIMSTYIKERVSLIGVVDVLEPFLIYSKHLTFKQYQTIVNFIDCKISKYNKEMKTMYQKFNNIKRFKSSSKYLLPQAKTVYEMQGAVNIKFNVFNSYGYDQGGSGIILSNSELLKKTLLDDYSNTYNSGAALHSAHLSYPGGLMPLFDSTKDEFKQMISDDRTKNTCTGYALAKKYTNKLELTQDNNVEIYYDKIFDKSPYNILESYEKEQRAMPDSDFFEFLVTKLMKKHKMTDEDAANLAQTLIDGLKKVHEGDYAVFFNTVTNKFEYYVRKSNKWEYDANANANLFVSDPNILCNLQPNCLYAESQINGLCESIDTIQDISKDTMMKSIVDQFDANYNKSKEERETGLKAKLDYFIEINDRLRKIRRNKYTMANNMQYELGLALVDSPELIVSPYKKIMNIILGLSDAHDRNTNIIKFSELCTREHVMGKEDAHWLYCNKTETKLLPAFVSLLAKTFITNNAEYDNVLQKIKKDIGVLSDDGDKIVDMYSGIEIEKIQLSSEEGYNEEGFKVTSRGLLEEDWGGEASTNEKDVIEVKKKDIIMTPETKIVHIIVSAISSAMGIHIPAQMEFIVRNVKNMLVELLYSEEEHELKNEALLKKGKPITPYEDHKNGIILYLTLGMFIIAVQTNIPSIKTRKTFPGCNSSLKGYPLGSATELDFVNYLACVVHKTRIASGPWKVLMKKKEDYIATAIFSYIDQYLLKTQEVSQKLKDKQLYLYELSVKGTSMEMEEVYGTSHFDGFLPPLKSFTIKHLNGVTTEFEESLLNNLKTGSHNQQDQITTLQSKILLFSFALQEELQNVIDSVVTKSLKKNNSYDLLISYGSQFPTENACCNDDTKNNALLYFTEKSDKIDRYNRIVHSYSQIMLDIKYQTTARQFLSIVNTKNSYPQIGAQFNKTTVYRAFISYCNFLNKKQIPESLLHICSEKPVGIRKSDSIKEQIKKMENEGKTFSNEAMSELLLVVSKQNIVGTDMPPAVPTRVQRFRVLLENFYEKGSTRLLPEPLAKLMTNVLDSTPERGVDAESSELRELRNYLLGANKSTKKTIITFITKHADLSKDKISEFSSFLNTVINWSDNTSRNKLNMTDSDLYNSINFVKTYLHNFARVFPNIILVNKPDKYGKKFNLPKHWGVSSFDEVGIKDNVRDYYNPLNEFFNNKILMQPLSNVRRNLESLIEIADETPCASIVDPAGSEMDMLGVFDKDTCLYLFEYYFLMTINEYIEQTAQKPVKLNARLPRVQESASANIFSSDKNDTVVNFEATQEREFVSQMNEGAKKQVKIGVAKLLTVYMEMMLTHKLTVNVSYSYIMENVFKIQRAETRTFTERLESLNDDEREADTALKILKLGKWNKGLQKSLTVYNKDLVDEDTMANNERYQGIERAIRLNKRNVDVADMDQAVEDYLEEQNAEEQDQLELGMGGIGEDYYDGDPYGDEYGGMDE